jgi:hypothetical protein
MVSKVNTVKDYIQEAPVERQEALKKLCSLFKKKLPKGFKEGMGYGMIAYYVPHELYPKGYHCSPELPLPFINIASQKNFIAVYHMGLYAEPSLLKWFTDEYPKHSSKKLDMGKSCLRFKKVVDIPYDLIGALASKISPEYWIALYEKNIRTK